jgi:L-ascorbate metabolism protein UlaG (beta-lactamase superfamily)
VSISAKVEVQYLTWSCFLFTSTDGERILIDPFLAGDEEMQIPPSATPRAELYPLDAVVVTHAAFDHLGEAIDIVKECDAVLCGAADVRVAALQAGIPDDRIVLQVAGTTYDAGSWSLKALYAKHLSFSKIGDQYVSGHPLSYILDFGGLRVFHAGDTAISSDFPLFGQLYQPNVAILGVDGAFINGRALVELDPREAAVAAQMLGVSTAMPMHYRPAAGAQDEFLEQVRKTSPTIDVLIPPIGGKFDLAVAATTTQQSGS